MIYTIVIEYFNQLPILCGLPCAVVAMFCCISFLDILSVEWRSVSCQILSSTIGMCTPSSFRLGSLCNLFFWQKWTHFVFVSENLKPFTVAHLLIFISSSCSFHLIVWIYFDLQHIMKSSTYSDPSIPDGNFLVILFIFILNRVTDNILPCGILSSWFLTLENVVSTQTLNFLLDKNPSINYGNLPFITSSCKSFITQYFHVI